MIPSESPSGGGHDHFGARVARFDVWVDQQLETIRGNTLADTVFTNASHLGDFSLIWHIIGTARGLTSARRADQAVWLSGALALESVIVNQGIKRLFRRGRPTTSGDDRFTVRQPSTISFPSGHASSAFFAAVLLSTWGGKRTAPLWFGTALIVAISRVYVRIHHASDIVGGAVVGLTLGSIARRIVRSVRGSPIP